MKNKTIDFPESDKILKDKYILNLFWKYIQ